MGPGWFNLVFSLHTGLRKLKVGFLEVRERSEDVFLNHSHDIVEVRNNETNNCFLVLE
jgi:hypothetical protein